MIEGGCHCGSVRYAIDGQAITHALCHCTDVQTATYDDPNVLPAKAHIQTADRIAWMKSAHELPEFERYPPQS